MVRLLGLAATAAFAASQAQARLSPYPGTTSFTGYINYTTVTGYFLQDEESTNATTFDFTTTDFGLINQTYAITKGDKKLTQWQKFALVVDHLNAKAPDDTVYKVMFLGRHGEGYHNQAQDYYGTPAWNCYWGMENGNGTISWEDANLTPAGVEQAQVVNDFWAYEIENEKIQTPQSFYTSPLRRCLETANISFSGLDLPAYYPFVPTIKELLREGISIHTCDHRHSKRYIHERYPTWPFDDDFSEYDELWDGVTAESTAAQTARSKKWLDQVFATDDHTWISVTSHSGELASTLAVLGHRVFPLNTGAVIPVLVKAIFLPADDAPATTSWSWTTTSHCTAPPATSIATLAQGCVCANSATQVTTPLVKVTATDVSGPTAYPGPDYKL